ncbi:MAG: S1-C subfamily serine protease, partial [Pirellulaceae bacterium]
KEVTFDFTLDPQIRPLSLVNSRGESVKISTLISRNAKPTQTITLEPREPCSIPTMSLGLGAQQTAPSLESPLVDQYELSFELGIVQRTKDLKDVWSEILTSPALKLKIVKNDKQALRVETFATYGDAADRMAILKPVFGRPHRGIEMGLAISTFRRRFAIGEHIPMDLYFRNAGKKEATFRYHPDFSCHTPSVVNSRGEKMKVSGIMTWMEGRTYNIALKPGESSWVRTAGLGIASRFPNFVSPTVGKYKIKFSDSIIWNNSGKPDSWSELESGSLEFEVFDIEADKKYSAKGPIYGPAVRATVKIHTIKFDKTKPTETSPDGRPSNNGVPTNNGRKPVSIEGITTGFIVNDRGYIVTACHAVSDADSIQVALNDGTVVPASLVGTDEEHDLAMLRIHSPKALPVMPEQRKEPAKIGDAIVAIGTTTKTTHSISRGSVFRTGRDVQLSETRQYKNVIDIETGVQRGGSGGPLLNSKGEVVGMMFASRAFQSKIGFALPISTVRKSYVGFIDGHITGRAAHEQIAILKPAFGAPKNGVQLGVACSTLQRKFAIHSKIPMTVFFRNIGQKKVTFQYPTNYLTSPPSIVDPQGESIRIPSIVTYRYVHPYTISLEPGEAYGIPTPGLTVGQQAPLSFKPEGPGIYKVVFSDSVRTGALELEIIQNESGAVEVLVLEPEKKDRNL